MESQTRNVGWDLLGPWLLATVVGWGVGLIVTIVLSYAVLNRFHPEETNLIAGVCIGASVGSAQVVAIRRVLPLSWVWVLGVIIGMGVPYTVVILRVEAWFGAVQVSGIWLVPIVLVAGTLAGFLQVGALKRHTLKAHRWIWMSVVTWGVTWLISVSLREPGLAVGTLVFGALSGAFLIRLVRASLYRDAL